METKQIKIIAAVLGFLIFLTILFRFLASREKAAKNILLPSPFPTSPINYYTTPRPPIQKLAPLLYIKATDPQDGEADVPLDKLITISFNRSFKEGEIEFFLSPEIKYSLKIEGENLIITPSSAYNTGTKYTFSVNYKTVDTLPRAYSFTTIGPTQTYEPDTSVGSAVAEEEQYQLENNPDIYLANKTPYSTESFSINSSYRKTYPGHLFFTVSLKGPNFEGAKNEFTAWLKSLGLSDAKIQTLDIEYQ